MALTFIGFSGSGKSHYSRVLERDYAWSRIDCDTLILHALNSKENINLITLPEIASWHGSPSDPDFPRRDRLLLDLEHQVMLNILEENQFTRHTVIDTSGSFVLLPEDTILKFKAMSKIIHFRYEDIDIDRMIEQYFIDPKPVIWQHLYQPREGEEYLDSIKRCYVDLVQYRRKLYDKYADITIDISFSKRGEVNIKELLEGYEVL